MKKLYITGVTILLMANSLWANKYTLTSGKWTDPQLWGDNYPGPLVKSSDIVVITGVVVINTSVIVEGTLEVEKGASMVGTRDLIIARSGTFINNGNTAIDRIENQGSIVNNMSMDAVADIDNSGSITNNSNMVAGNDFNNSGTVEGKKSTYFVQNNLVSNPLAKFGTGIQFFAANTMQAPADLPTSANNMGVPVPNKPQEETDSLSQMMRTAKIPDGN